MPLVSIGNTRVRVVRVKHVCRDEEGVWGKEITTSRAVWWIEFV